MTVLLVALAALVAVAAAVRSTWSPCGWSVLSTITPLAEQARGHRYRTTALWFVVGGVVGGITLGVGAALLAAVVGWIGPPASVALGVAAVAATISACSDLQLLGFRLPGTVRQVNEVWLGKYRSWVYGSGFGWQVGVGLATFLMTAGVYLVIVLAALTGNPLVALACAPCSASCAASRSCSAPSSPRRPSSSPSTRGSTAPSEPVRRVVIAVQFAAATAFAAVAWNVVVPIVGAVLLVGVALATTTRRAVDPATTS